MFGINLWGNSFDSFVLRVALRHQFPINKILAIPCFMMGPPLIDTQGYLSYMEYRVAYVCAEKISLWEYFVNAWHVMADIHSKQFADYGDYLFKRFKLWLFPPSSPSHSLKPLILVFCCSRRRAVASFLRRKMPENPSFTDTFIAQVTEFFYNPPQAMFKNNGHWFGPFHVFR